MNDVRDDPPASPSLLIAPVAAVEDAHRALTYPLYARQLEARLAAGEWLVLEARRDGEVVGLAVVLRGSSGGELLSVAVARPHRRQGIGSGLLEWASRVSAEADLPGLTTSFRRSLANAAAIRAFLMKNGWAEPEAESAVGEGRADREAEAVHGFASRFPVGFGASVIPWSATTPEQRRALESASAEAAWIPPALAPARFEGEFFEPEVSFAVVARGAVVGWLLVLVAPGAVPKADFCCGYVHPEWARRGTFMWLLARTIARLRERHPGFIATWTVSQRRPETRRFFQRRLAPLGVRFDELLVSRAPTVSQDGSRPIEPGAAVRPPSRCRSSRNGSVFPPNFESPLHEA